MRYVFMFAFLLLLSGCFAGVASTVTIPGQYIEPVTQGLGTVSNFSRNSGGNSPEYWENYLISKIDDKRVYYIEKFLIDRDGYYSASWKVASGRHTLEVKAEFNDKQAKEKLYEAYITLDVNITPFTRYRLEGKVENNQVHIWLLDRATGEVASPIASSPYREVTITY